MHLFNKIILTTCGLIAPLVFNNSANVVIKAQEQETNLLSENLLNQQKKFLSEQEIKYQKEINLAKSLAEKYFKSEQTQKQKYNNKIVYKRGTDKFESDKGIGKWWVTKAFLGNVATIIGASGATLGMIITAFFIALTLYGFKIAGPIGGILAAFAAAFYAFGVAFIMNKVNKWEIGGVMYVDYSLILSPLTAALTLREQDEFESRKQIVKLDQSIKYPNKKSYDFDFFDKTKAKIWSDYDYDRSSNFSGVIDISRYVSQLKFRKIKSIDIKFFFEDIYGKMITLNDEKLLKFIEGYFEKNLKNDYLFFILKNNEVSIGGNHYADDNKVNEHWIKRKITNNPIKHIGTYLTLNFEEL